MKMFMNDNAMYQCMEMLYCPAFTTLITRESPSLASMVGPGNCPFTVSMLWVLHSLLTGIGCTYFVIIQVIEITN